MAGYIVRRLVAIVPTLLGLSLILFLLVRLMPGDAALLQAFAGEGLILEGETDPAVIQEMRRELGIDKPIPLQYLVWLGDTARLDFGTSYWTRNSVTSEIRRRLAVTVELLLLSVLVAVGTGLVIGVVSAIYQDTTIDYLGRLVGVLGLSLPNFWIALLVILLPRSGGATCLRSDTPPSPTIRSGISSNSRCPASPSAGRSRRPSCGSRDPRFWRSSVRTTSGRRAPRAWPRRR